MGNFEIHWQIAFFVFCFFFRSEGLLCSIKVHFFKPAVFRIAGLHVICMRFQIHSLPHVALLRNACVDWKGAIPDMIIKLIFNCGGAGSKPTPRSIKPEPRKPLLPLALDMFMFQLAYVKQPPTRNVFVWVLLCKYGCRSVYVCVHVYMCACVYVCV